MVECRFAHNREIFWHALTHSKFIVPNRCYSSLLQFLCEVPEVVIVVNDEFRVPIAISRTASSYDKYRRKWSISLGSEIGTMEASTTGIDRDRDTELLGSHYLPVFCRVSPRSEHYGTTLCVVQNLSIESLLCRIQQELQ